MAIAHSVHLSEASTVSAPPTVEAARVPGTTPSGAQPPHSQRPSRRGLSIQQKLLALILVLVVGVATLLAGYLQSHQLATMHAALESKATTYGRLVAKQVESAIAFDDQETAREVFESVAQDPDVESLTLFTARGDVLRARGSLSAELMKHRTGIDQPILARLDGRVAAIVPVVSLEGPRGTLILELSDRRLIADANAVQRRVGMAGVLALLVGALGAVWIARSLSRRLRAVAEVAEAVAAGDLEQRPVDVGGSGDEIGVMANAFNTMLSQLKALFTQIKRSAQEEQERLEGLVRARTSELDARNDDMRRVLDNVGQGFFTLDAQARLSRERSAVLQEWFGPLSETESFVDVLARVAPASAAWFDVAWQSFFDGVMPLEVSIDQLPKRLTVDGRDLTLTYRPVDVEGDRPIRVLVVISDVTAELSRARAENDEREVTRLFARIFADRAGFLEFFAEAQAQVESIVGNTYGPNIEGLKRALHTLKGNVSLHGLESVAKICHALEDEFKDHGALSPPLLEQLHQRWAELSSKVRTLLGDSDVRIEIDDDEYDNILEAIQRGESRLGISEMIQAWRLEPTHRRLNRIAEQATALAARLGKEPIEVRIESNRIRLEPEQWAEFWSSSVHLIRNAVDHGLESREERITAGKKPAGTVTLRTSLDADSFYVEFQDDGRGIDWNAVAVKAAALELPTATRADLVNALFVSGFSTRSETTEVSGRGIGLSAVREACRKLGGRAEVISTQGQGTTFRFVWPAGVLRQRSRNGQGHKPISMSVGLRWASLPPGAQ